MSDHVLRRNAQLFYNGSLLAQLAALGLLFTGTPYYAGVGATLALVLGVLAVYSLTAGTRHSLTDVVRTVSLRSRLFIGLAVIIIIGSAVSLLAQPTDAVAMAGIVEAYARTALAIGATSLLLYADYRQRDTEKVEEDNADPAARALDADEVREVDWGASEE